MSIIHATSKSIVQTGGDSLLFPRDVFISHASENKETHARPVDRALNKLGISTWFDEAMIRDGDSLVDSVGLGLDKATFVLLLITKEFIHKGWPETELRNALSHEIATGVTRVIPLVDIPHEEFVQRYPLMRDKKYRRWHVSEVDTLAHAIHHRLNRHPAPWTFGQHPDDYKGPVWIRITPATGNANKPHTIRILWGQYLFERELYIPDGPLSLTHHKTNLGSIPLQINVEPAATVTVGQGPPSDEEWVNIDEGWTRLAGVPIWA